MRSIATLAALALTVGIASAHEYHKPLKPAPKPVPVKVDPPKPAPVAVTTPTNIWDVPSWLRSPVSNDGNTSADKPGFVSNGTSGRNGDKPNL
jgi:hypothetical protein